MSMRETGKHHCADIKKCVRALVNASNERRAEQIYSVWLSYIYIYIYICITYLYHDVTSMFLSNTDAHMMFPLSYYVRRD